MVAKLTNWCRTRGPAWLKENVIAAVVVLLILAALPLLAILLITMRALFAFAVVVAIVFGLAAYVLSPAFRHWLHAFTDSLVKYKGLRLATDVRFHPSHSWAREEGDVSVGVDDLVQAALGPVDDVELPPSGLHVAQGERLFRLYHGNRAVDVRSPVSGTVLEVNAALRGHPQFINDEPFARGWAVRIRSDDPSLDRKNLLRGKQARTWFRSSADSVISLLPASAAPLAGEGESVAQLHRHISDATWRQLSETMFAAS